MSKFKELAVTACIVSACLPALAAAAPPAAAPDPVARTCWSDNAAADALGAGSRVVRTKGSPQRETLYLPDAAYIVRRCDATGDLKRATLYRRHTSPYTKAFYQPEKVLERTDTGGLSALYIDYGSPTAVGGEALWRQAAAENDAEPPADAALLTSPTASPASRVGTRSAPRRATSRQTAAGKCASSAYAFLSPTTAWLPSHGFGYYVNLPSQAWDAAVEVGRVAIDDRWNQCGFQVPQQTSSYRIGYWQGGGFNPNDGVNMVTAGTGATVAAACQTVNVLACARSWPGAGPYQAAWGPYYQASNLDMIFNLGYGMVDGAAAGYYDIGSIAKHEFMHVYGVDHNGDINSIMYPNCVQCYESTAGRYSSRGDLNAISHLYG